jgi:hypothetical protein
MNGLIGVIEKVSCEWRGVKADFVATEWFETLQTQPESSPEERQHLLEPIPKRMRYGKGCALV